MLGCCMKALWVFGKSCFLMNNTMNTRIKLLVLKMIALARRMNSFLKHCLKPLMKKSSSELKRFLCLAAIAAKNWMNFSTCHCSNRPRLQTYKESTCVVRCFFYSWRSNWRVWSSLFHSYFSHSNFKTSKIRQENAENSFDPRLWFWRNIKPCLGYSNTFIRRICSKFCFLLIPLNLA